MKVSTLQNHRKPKEARGEVGPEGHPGPQASCYQSGALRIHTPSVNAGCQAGTSVSLPEDITMASASSGTAVATTCLWNGFLAAPEPS